MNKNIKIAVGTMTSILLLSVCLCVGGCVALHVESEVLEKTIVKTPTKIEDRDKEIIGYGLPPCSQLVQFAGTEVICQVDRVYCSYEPSSTGYATFCTDAPSPNEKFTLLIWNDDWSYLDGECIIIKGPISMFAEKPQIVFLPSRVNVSPCEP